MKRKDIQSLFPPLPKGVENVEAMRPLVESDRMILWRKVKRWCFETDDFSQPMRITIRFPIFGPRGILEAGGQADQPVLFRPPVHLFRSGPLILGETIPAGQPVRMIGSPEDCRGLLRYQGLPWRKEIKLPSGRSFQFTEIDAVRPTLLEDGVEVARHYRVWKDSELSKDICSRMWISPDLPEQDAMMIAALLLIDAVYIEHGQY